MVRGNIYYVRLQINGRAYWRSTPLCRAHLKLAIRKAAEIKVGLRKGVDFPSKRDAPTFSE